MPEANGHLVTKPRDPSGPLRQRGLGLPQIILFVLLVALLGFAAWWYLGRTSGPATMLPGAADATAPAAADTAASAPEAESADLTVDQLYKEARTAMNENRMVTPAGKNALEYYLRIVAKQPDDAGAKDALRELFPFATAGVEDQINQGNFDEATRIMGLLAKADPSNYTLTILRSKLDSRRRQNEREEAQRAAQEAAAAAAAARTAQAPAASSAGDAATTTAAAAATPAAGESTGGAATRPAEVATTTAPAPAAAPTPPPAPVGETRDVRVISPPRPSYPPAAVRNRQDGWVEVEFTVAADGSVQNAHVTASEPSRVFDREAVSAVQRAKFEPRLENGQPVASTLRRRIEFKLNN